MEQDARQPHAAQRVLIIDDNRDSADSLRMLLQIWGFDAICANDGAEGLSAAQTFSPEIVLLDIGLPGTSGYEVAQQLRRLPQTEGSVLVAITGYGQDEDRRRASAAGFDHHLVKPVDPTVLEQLLQRLRTPSPDVRH